MKAKFKHFRMLLLRNFSAIFAILNQVLYSGYVFSQSQIGLINQDLNEGESDLHCKKTGHMYFRMLEICYSNFPSCVPKGQMGQIPDEL